jgi:peptidyl-prolyl cis-trans isomerase D
MLQQIREKLTGGIAVVILALIGIPFLFFGVSNLPFIGSRFAATVDGSEIGAVDFEQTYRDQLQRNPSWAQLPDEYRVQLRRQILNSMIRDRLVDMHLIKKGYQISDTQLRAAVQRVPQFQVDGKFDMETYKSVLLQNGLDPKQFEERQRSAMREDQLRRAIGGTALVTPAEFRRYLNLIAEQRLVSLASFDIDGVAESVDVTDDEVTGYYDDNSTLYMTPESADVQFIEVRRDAVAANIAISEDALREYYDAEKDRYAQDEQREARHILIPFGDDEAAAEAKAQELLARAQAGEPFEDLAKQYSQDGGTAANGGDLGMLTRSQLPGELGTAIFAMNEGDVKGPIRSDFGFHIVRLDKVLQPGPLPLEQVRGELLAELRDRQADTAFRELERHVSDVLFDTQDMQAIADATGLELQTATGITRAGGDPIGTNQAAIDAIFDERVLRDGDITEVVELDNNRSAVFRVTEYHEAARQPLDEVRDQVVEAIRTQKAESIVFNQSEQLLAALDAGEDFAVAAEAAGARVSAPMLVSRRQEDVDQSVLTQVFLAKKPAEDTPVRGKVAMAGGGYTVYSLDAVLPGRPESIPLADRDAGKLQLAQEAGASDYVAFVQALYDKADVVISQDVLAAQELLQ